MRPLPVPHRRVSIGRADQAASPYLSGECSRPARALSGPVTATVPASRARRGELTRCHRGWRDWAEDVRGRAIGCGHHIAEEAPDELAAELRDFFSQP